MGLLILLVVGVGVYLYYRRKRAIQDLKEKYRGKEGKISIGKCTRCGYPVNTKAKTCTHCGKSRPTRNLVLDTVLGIIAVYFVITILVEVIYDNGSSSPFGNEIFETGVVENKSTYIPELKPGDVYLSLEDIGFTTEKDLGSGFGHLWTSELSKGGIEYKVDISSDEILRVQRIRGVAINYNRNPDEVRQFFKYLTSSLFLHNNRNETQLNNWIDTNFNRDNAVTSVGPVKVKISAPSGVKRSVIINANLEDGM